jgi:hypothetical protein
MANILYRGSSYTTANTAGSKNAPLTNDEIDRNFYSLDALKFDKSGGTVGGDTTFSTNVTVSGNLTVSGTTTTINTTNLQVSDANIELGKVGSPSDATANGGGITLLGATNKTITWDSTNANWTSSEHFNIASGKSFKINTTTVLNSTTLGSGVVNSSLTKLGTGAGFVKSDANGNLTVDTNTYLTSVPTPGNGTLTISSSGAISASGSFTANQSGNTTISITHTDTSNATNLTASGRTYVTGLSFDDYGHVTGYSTGTETVTDTNTTYSHSAQPISGGGVYLRLSSSTGTNYDIPVKSGSNVTVAYDSSNSGVKISSSDTTSVAIKSSDGVIQFYAVDGDANGMRFAGSGIGLSFNNITNTVTHSVNYGTTSGTSCQGDDSRLNNTLSTVTGRGSTTSNACTFSGGLSVTGLTVSKNGTESLITFPAQTNDPGYIKHYENNNTAIMSFSVSDDAGSNDYFVFGNTSGGGFVEGLKITASGTISTGVWQGSSISTSYTDAKVTSVSGTSPITVTPTSGAVVVSHNTSGVGAGTYNNVTVDANGHVTGGSNVSYLTSKPSYSKSEISGLTDTSVVQFSGLTLYAAGVNPTLNFYTSTGSNYSYICNTGNSSSIATLVFSNTTTGTLGSFDNSGNFTATQDVTAFSDERLKTNWKDLPNNFIEQLAEVKNGTYDRIDGDKKTQVGVSAQSLQKVLPCAVLEGDEYLSVAYGNAALASAVELAKEMVSMRKLIEQLSAKVEDLQNQLANK